MTTSSRTLKGRTYENQNLECPICHRLFKNEQGRKAHIRQIHERINERITVDQAPGSAVRKDEVDSISGLREDCERLELLAKRRRLTSELPATSTRTADLMEQSGLGPFTEESRTLAQKRAMGIRDQDQVEGWFSKLLSAPGGIQAGVDALRGIIGVGHNNEGSGLGILKELGVDLKQLWERGQATKADSALSVGGINLNGVRLTPEVLTSLIAFKQAEDDLNYQKTKDASFRDNMNVIIDLVKSSGILNRIGGEIAKGSFPKPGAERDISEKYMPEVADNVFTCPVCQTENTIPADAQPGVRIQCQGPGCEQSWVVEDPQVRQPQRQVKKKPVKIEEPIIEETACPGCGQLLSLANRSIGDIIRCGVCGDELTVTSETLAVPASEPLTKLEKQSQEFLRGKGE